MSDDYTPTKPQPVDVPGSPRDAGGDPEADLREALAADPADQRAAASLTTLLIAAGRFAEAAAVIEAELDALAARAESGEDGSPAAVAHRAERHRQVARLGDGRPGRADRALYPGQQAWQLGPLRTEALEAARAIYASLGKHKMVAQLYQAELEILGDAAPAERRARTRLALGRLLARHGDPR